MTLAEALIELQDPRSPTRDAAMQVVVRWCERSVRSYLVNLFGADMADTDMIEQAIAHLEIRSATQSPTSQYQGTTEGEAVRWCQAVVRNRATSWWRRHKDEHQASRLTPQAGETGAAARGDPIDGQAHSDPGPTTVELEQAVRWLLAGVSKRAEAGELTALQKAQVEVFLEHRFRLSDTARQIADWASRGVVTAEPEDGESRKRARDRIYKDRQRGRETVEGILADTPPSGQEDMETREELARILDLGRSRKGGGRRTGNSG